MSIPAEMPADVTMPSSTYRSSPITEIVGSIDASVSRAPQCVVARLTRSSPARANSNDPVQTEDTRAPPDATLLIQDRRLESSRSRRVPQPPGITSKSIVGQLAMAWIGVVGNPPTVTTVLRLCATVKTLKAAPSSERLESSPGLRRAREKNPNRPAKPPNSNTSNTPQPTTTAPFLPL